MSKVEEIKKKIKNIPENKFFVDRDIRASVVKIQEVLVDIVDLLDEKGAKNAKANIKPSGSSSKS